MPPTQVFCLTKTPKRKVLPDTKDIRKERTLGRVAAPFMVAEARTMTRAVARLPSLPRRGGAGAGPPQTWKEEVGQKEEEERTSVTVTVTERGFNKESEEDGRRADTFARQL